jgi:transcriptional regulator with XRE-family HTH domain
MSSFAGILGCNIRNARERLGLTQQNLADAIGLASAQIISEIESGSRQVKAWELVQLAKALYMDYEELLSGRPLVFDAQALWRKEPAQNKAQTEAHLSLLAGRYRRLVEME